MRCEEIRDLAPEIALGIADGEQRAEALRHLSTCGECRRVVEQLSQVADELLVLAPTQEPPPGFESRVVKALGLDAPPRRRRARWLTPRWLATREWSWSARTVTRTSSCTAGSRTRPLPPSRRPEPTSPRARAAARRA